MKDEIELIQKPKRVLSTAIHAVKGENTAKLIEDFTSEMSLIAEGLCEDQAILRKTIEKNETHSDEKFQSQESHINMLEKMLDDERHENDRIVTELRNRLSLLEKQQINIKKKEKKKSFTVIRGLTILVSIAAGAWIVVTLLQKLL